MSNVSGVGVIWDLPNYIGELYTADFEQLPILSMIGGITADALGDMEAIYKVDNFFFPEASTYEYPSVAQPEVTETTSLTAPTAVSYVRGQQYNTCQIFHEAVNISYVKASATGYLSGVTSNGMMNPVMDEKDFQILRQLGHIKRDFEYSILLGSYQAATDEDTAAKIGGINEAASDASNTVAAGSIDLSTDLINELLRTMYAAGAIFRMPVIFVNAFQKQQLSGLYGYAPTDRTIGGVNIKQIETDFGPIGVVLHPFQTTSVLTVAEMSVIKPVSLPVPGKGVLFYEELAKVGAAEQGQLFGNLGIDRGPNFMHGTITGLTTS